MPVTEELDGHNFFTTLKDGTRAATPLFAALVVISTDVIFTVDSVPAVLAVSNEPYIVFASNAFASSGSGRCTSCSPMPRNGSTTQPRPRRHPDVRRLQDGREPLVHLNTWVSLGILVAC